MACTDLAVDMESAWKTAAFATAPKVGVVLTVRCFLAQTIAVVMETAWPRMPLAVVVYANAIRTLRMIYTGLVEIARFVVAKTTAATTAIASMASASAPPVGLSRKAPHTTTARSRSARRDVVV